MWATIRQTSAPVILMAVLLFMGVGYSLYKAATSFSVQVDSPIYDRTPSDAIVAPELETVIPQNDPVATRSDQGGFRLPDEALFRISAGNLAIADALQSESLSPTILAREGFEDKDGEQSAYLQGLYQDILSGTDGERYFETAIQNDLSSKDFAQSEIVLYLVPDDGSALKSLSLNLGWEPGEDGWELVAISDSLL